MNTVNERDLLLHAYVYHTHIPILNKTYPERAPWRQPWSPHRNYPDLQAWWWNETDRVISKHSITHTQPFFPLYESPEKKHQHKKTIITKLRIRNSITKPFIRYTHTQIQVQIQTDTVNNTYTHTHRDTTHIRTETHKTITKKTEFEPSRA